MYLVAALAVVAAVVGASLPPRAARVPPAAWAGPTTVRGAVHIHSIRSDGSGTVDEIAAAAARAGLQFVIVTDHGDGTRPPDPPSYRSGVLTIDAVELNTTGGHYMVLGLPATPYPFAGAPDAVIEDVRRMGGVGFAAHPGSPRASLTWTGWDARFDGLEWLNADSEWRDEVWDSLGRTLLTYMFRSPETLASLLDRPTDVLARWDALGAGRRVPALAGADAHARLGFRPRSDPDTSALHVPLPSYEASFRGFSNHVILRAPLVGDPAADADAVVTAMAHGRSYTVIDGIASPGALEFTASSATASTGMGGEAPLEGRLTLNVRIAAPPNTTLMLLKDGATIESTESSAIEAVAEDPGVYRVEAYVAGGPGQPPVPWIVSNPIYVGLAHPAATPPAVPAAARVVTADLAQLQTEMGRGCTSEIAPGALPGAMSWRYALAPGRPTGQFAAVQLPVAGGLASFDRVRLRVKASHPARVWVQLRAPVGQVERWGTTFYADTEEREIDVPLSAFGPIGVTSSARPPLDRVDSLLIVADTLNVLPGTSGELTITSVALVQ